MLRHCARLKRDDRGATAIEYGLILSLIVLVVVGSMRFLAGETIAMWNYVTEETGAVL